MRLRDLTPAETAAIEELRDDVRTALASVDASWRPDAAAIAAAPFLDDYEPRRAGLHGLCWGHQELGSTFVTTTPVVHRGEGWAITESGRVYLLGDPHPKPSASLDRILSGRRGKGRPAPEAAPEAEATAGPGVR
jgi:hypothetical protein